jgi:mevalonate kinase
MKAKAPGKVVLSGAYAVLEGSPCIVTAVDRYVTADATRPAQHIAAEVREAMAPPFPHIDASELRAEGRKLGLGSSAAIVVASLATSPEYPCSTPDEQASWLATLGELAEIPIFTDAVTQLRELARREGAVVMPSGAGGGDLALFFGHQPPSQSLLRSAAQWGVTRLPVRIGARGVHRLDG